MAHSSHTITTAALLASLSLLGCGSDPEPRPEPETETWSDAKPEPARPDYHELLQATPEPAVLDGRPVLLTGAPGGAYYETARGLARLGDEVRAPLALLSAEGSVDALYGVALGLGDLGIVQADVLRDPAHSGVREGVEVLWPLMREAVHVVVRPDGPDSLWDLSGKRIGIGPPGGGAATTAHNVIAALRQVQAELADEQQYVTFEAPTLVRKHTAAALADLQAGALDAVVVVGAEPVPALLRHGEQSGQPVRALSFDARVRAALAAIDPVYGAGEARVTVPAVLIARSGLRGWGPIERLTAHVQEAEGKNAFQSAHPAAVAVGEPVEAGLTPREGLSVRYRAPSQPMRIAAGAPAGTYARVAEGVARALGEAVTVEQLETTGAVQNLALVASGEAELAIVQEDVLLEALRRPGTARLVARAAVVAPLFTEEVHLIGARAQEGLAGLQVGLGEAGSGTLLTSERLLRAMGVERHRVIGLSASRATTLAALRAGDLDAALFVGGQPLEFLTGLEAPFAPLDEQPGYQTAQLDPQAYPQLSEPVPTVATRALLVSRFDLEAEQVAAIVQSLFANRQNLASLHPKWGELTEEALITAPEGLRLHPGVQQAREAGLEVDAADPW